MASNTLRDLFVIAMILASMSSAYAQNCEEVILKKAQKYLDKASASSNMPIDERIALFSEALSADENCLECRFGLARAQYQQAIERNRSYAASLSNFEYVVDQCPTFHADAYYYAGIISYGNQDYEKAVEYFEAFLVFDKESGKTSRDYDLKEQDVAAVLPEARFYVDFYQNPVAFNPDRLAGVSSSADEYLPMLSPDNAYLYFTRKEMVKNKGDLYAREVENFMQSEKRLDVLDFVNPQPLPPPFNIGDNYGGVSISLNNREMFVTVCKPVSSGYKNCDLYVTNYERTSDLDGKIKYKWSGLENLGSEVNTPDGWEAQPTLSADGNTLYFATIRKNTIPDKDGNPTIDIFSTTRQNGGKWSTAVSIGSDINTDGNDKSPFLHVDSRTLYFSSNGRIGAGGYDIYYSRQETEGGTWSKPKNLGYPINSRQDEHGLIVSTDGARAYFASANVKSSQGLDLYSFEVPQKARPQKVLLLKGDVKNEKGETVTEARIELKYTQSKETKEFNIDNQDGSYAAVINLRKDEDVVVSIKSDIEDVAFNTRVFTIADTINTVQEIEMLVESVQENKPYRINDIRFATASSEINEPSKRVLDEFADYLNNHTEIVIEIGGHTDNVGDPEQNLALSADRAFEVFGYLQQRNVSPKRMTFKGYGASQPIADNADAANRAQNRRTEFIIKKL